MVVVYVCIGVCAVVVCLRVCRHTVVVYIGVCGVVYVVCVWALYIYI